jgi:Reverse transcriptase (RNA-dependent DNA polymerase)
MPLAALADRILLEEQLEALHGRHARKGRSHQFGQGGLPLPELMLHKARAARMVSQAVRRGEYRPAPALVRRVYMKDRYRELFRLEALDFALHGVLGAHLSERLEPRLSPNLYSYRQRFSSWHAIRRLAAFARQYAKSGNDPRARGLHVLRCDVRRYIESVPVNAPSPLWPQLEAVLGISPGDRDWPLVESLVRPELVDEEGAASMRSVGLALGSPLATIILNLYLVPLDEQMDALDGFYVRFGDDMIFAHASAERTRFALATIVETLTARRLELNAKKLAFIHFNGAGRPSTDWPEARGARNVTFLGSDVGFDGTVSLPRAKWRALLADLRARIRRSRPLLADAAPGERGPALCEIVNQTLDPLAPLASPHARALRQLVTDRRQLEQLDYWAARAIAEALADAAGPRAFRALPPRQLREWGLRSLVALRNDD